MTKNLHFKDRSTIKDPTPIARSKHLQTWLGTKLKRWTGRGLIGGLGSTLLALPVLAQATSEQLDAFQFVASLPGVRSAKLLPNGDLELKMTDGRELVIAAEDIQVLENGTIMVAEEVAVQISQFAAVAEAGAAAATAGGISGTGLALGGLGVAGAAAAAGGGGGGSGDDPETRTDETVREPVASPPAPLPPSLNLAELQTDALNSFSTGVSAPENAATVEVTIGGVTKLVTPDVDGSWRVSLSQAEAGSLPQGVSDVAVRILDADGIELSSGGAQFDVDTVPPTLTISPVSGDGVLNALEQGADLTVSGTTDAENGQMVTVSLNGETYTTTASGGNWNVSVPAADLQSLTDGETIAITADVSDRAGNPATQANIDFDTDFTNPTVSLDPVGGGSIDLVDVQGDLALTGTTTAEDGQLVTVTFEGREYTAPATGGVWSVTIHQVDLAGLTTGSPVSVSVAVQDAAGNPAIPATANVPVDLTGPSISIAPLSVGNILNAAETGSPLTVSGSTGNVSDGQQVTVELNGQTYTGSVSGDSWSVTIPAVDLDALADGQGFTLTADVTDSDGLPAPQADVLLSKDVTAPTLSIDSLSHGAVLNAAERGSDLTISGATSAEDGQEITVTLNGQTYSGTAQSGSWFVTVPSGDLASLPDGTAITVLADVSDVAGNPAVQASDLFNTDFTAPTLAIDPLAVGAVMNASERASDFVISGSSDAVDGTSVSIEIVRSDNTVEFSGTATVAAGSWTFTVPSGNLSSLQDAETYDVNASVSDAAGNSSAASTSIATDFSAPTLSMDPLDVGSVMDVIERGADLTVSGTTSAADSQVVAVTLDGQVYNASISGGVWTMNIPSANLAALSDGQTYTVSASVQDANGNEAINADTSFSTNFKPVLSLDPLGTNDAVLLSDAVDSGVIVSGQSAGLLAGQAIDITLNGSSVGTATVAADGSWSANVPGPAFAGFTEGDTLDFAAQATVAGGPDPDPVSDQVTAYTPAPYVISEVGRSGSTITFAIHADPDQDVSGGLGFDADLGFDPSVVAFNAGSNVEHDDFAIFSVNDGSNPVRFGGAALSISDLSQPLVTFEMTILDEDQPIELELTSLQGGPLHVSFGTSAADTLAGTNGDDIIQGGAGDDTIDLTGAGRDLVVFEAAPSDNGLDVIDGFNLGPAADVSDALMFRGLDNNSLRGDGTVVELLGSGGSLGTNTGFVGLTTQLTNLDEDTIAAAAETLSGAQAGDEIFILATDGTNSALVKVGYSAPDTATVEKMSQFNGLSDLNGFGADNVLLADPTGASA